MPPVPLPTTTLHLVRNEEPPPGAGPHWTPRAMDLQLSGAAAERFMAHCREMARTSILSLGESMVKLGEALRAAGALAELPPEDPRERALYLVQNRNTGPARPLATERRRRR